MVGPHQGAQDRGQHHRTAHLKMARGPLFRRPLEFPTFIPAWHAFLAKRFRGVWQVLT